MHIYCDRQTTELRMHRMGAQVHGLGVNIRTHMNLPRDTTVHDFVRLYYDFPLLQYLAS